jgi:hypothetical protein
MAAFYIYDFTLFNGGNRCSTTAAAADIIIIIIRFVTAGGAHMSLWI